MAIDPDRKKAIILGFGVGVAIGLPVAAILASFAAWGGLMKRQRDLARDWSPAQVIVATKPFHAGDLLLESGLAIRPVPEGIVSPNTVLPDDEKELAGRHVAVDLMPGDVVLRSTVGLAPRP